MWWAVGILTVAAVILLSLVGFGMYCVWTVVGRSTSEDD